MTTTPHNAADAATDAALRSALASNLPGLEVSQGTADGGQQWSAITYPAGVFLIHRDTAGTWHAHGNGPGQASGAGMTPANALKEAPWPTPDRTARVAGVTPGHYGAQWPA